MRYTHAVCLKGHRIGIETILLDYLDGLTPDEIVRRSPTLTPEKIYATITYYWHYQDQVTAYLQAGEEHHTRMRAEQEQHPSPADLRLRALVRAHKQSALILKHRGCTSYECASSMLRDNRLPGDGFTLRAAGDKFWRYRLFRCPAKP
jgi:uncharacterized protein (DUF433 family)